MPARPGSPRCSMPSTFPRREDRSPITSPMFSSGVTTSTAMTGSSSTGLALPGGVLHGHGPGDLEGHLRGVDVVVRAVGQGDPDVDHGVAGQDPVGQGLLDPGVDGRDVLLGDDAARDLVDELVAPAGAGGLQADDHMAVLTPATGLADVPALDLLHLLADGLPVGHLGLADVGVHAEFPQHPVDQDLQVELAHSRDHRLAGLVVGADPEGGVLLGQRVAGPCPACPGRLWSWARRPRG